ncbi:MAG TPA: hypothetical protein VHY59_13400, partial [Chthoniobacterales bacterium]|nr:hypothetical protein [Chthoniobacterales bacterium]
MADAALEKSAAQKFLQEQGGTFDFQRYFFLIRRRLWLLALVVLLGMIGTGLWVWRQPQVYGSRAVLQIE